MNQIEFLSRFKSEIKFNTFSEKSKENIENYLSGEINSINVVSRKNRIYTSFFSVLENEIDSDYSEVAKRAIKLMFYIYPNETFSHYKMEKIRYEIYNKIGLDSEVVKEDIVQSINDIVGYYGNRLEENISAFLTEHKNGKELKNEWSLMFSYFGEIAESIVVQNVRNAKEQMAGLVLSVLGMKFFKTDEEKALLFRQNAEESVLAVVNQLYKVNLIKDKLKEYFNDNEISLFFNYSKKTSLFYDIQILEKVFVVICRLFYKYSTIINNSYKLCLIQYDNIEYLQKFDDNEESLVKLYRKFELPYTFDVNLYSNLMIGKGFQKQGLKYFEKLIELLNTHKNAFLDVYESNKKLYLLNWVVLLVVLLKSNEEIISNDIDKAENCILQNLKSIINQGNKRDRVFEFVYYEVSNNDPFVIKDINFVIEKASINCIPYNSQYNMIVTTASILFGWSCTAKKITALFMNTFAEWREGSNLNIFRVALQIFSEPNDKDCYELLSEIVGAEKVIETYLNFEEAYKDILEFRKFLKKHNNEATSYLRRMIYENNSAITYYVDIMYGEELGFEYEEIMPVFESKMKTVVDFMESFFEKRSKSRTMVEKLLQTKNKNTKQSVCRLIKLWDTEKTTEEMMKITSAHEMSEYILKRFDKSSEKLIPFQNEVDFGNIRFINSEEKAPEYVMKYYIAEYMLLKSPRNILECSMIKKFLNKGDVRRLTQSIFELWMENGAETKQKNLLPAYTNNCSEEDIINLKKQIDVWTENSRGALASFAVTAMALNGSDIALMLTDSIATKYKNKQVRSEAQKAMESAATNLGITTDELADRIIPNLGFDSKREKWLDYGQRKFRIYMNQKMEAIIFDENGKQIKALPKATTSDNQELADEAKEELKGMKKQLKAIISTQKNRLETAVVTGRKWTRDKWIKVFVENPIMNCFATGLIWEEVDENDKLIGTFRYMEDGSYNTSEEEEYQLEPNSIIMLFNTLDAEKSVTEEWQSQLEDYEVIQPIKQLTVPVYTLTDDEKEQTEITRFFGTRVYFGTIRSVMEKYDWKKTSIVDGGGYDGYYFEQDGLDVGIQILFNFLYVGMSADDTASIEKLVFYKKGAVSYGGYCYDEIDSGKRVMPINVKAKLMSFALMVADSIAQKSVDK